MTKPSYPDIRRERALRVIAERGLQLAEALAGEIHRCRTAQEMVRLADAFARISEEVCGAIALEAELRRERQANPPPERPRRLRGETPASGETPRRRVH